ncbi:MAG: hypothetical protein U0795_00670 [Pirellulales bacterium]
MSSHINCSRAAWAMVAICTTFLVCVVSSRTLAQAPLDLESQETAEVLSRLHDRLDELERENQGILNQNAQLLDQINAHRDENSIGGQTSASTYSPGEGITISMLNNTSKLTVGASLSALATFSTSRPFSASLPLFLFPASPLGVDSNTFDLQARQSSINARFTGPEVLGLTPGAEILTLFFNDNITDDNYGLLVYYAYGELKNDQMRFAAGLQRDIFNPVGPTVLPFSLLYGSGNAGSYRGQIRYERFVPFGNDSLMTLQSGLSESISTLVVRSLQDPLVEDNGWPNLEGRVAMGFGETQEYLGGRKQRPVEFGVSGVVGQIRISKLVPGPGTTGPDRVVDDVRALGCDLQWVMTDRLGMKGELFIGRTLGEYNAGVLQNFNSETFLGIRTKGAYGELYWYFNPKLHLHCGYGIDDPYDNDLAASQIASNQTFMNTLLYDLSKTVQFGFEVDYRKTNYVSPALDANAVLFMSQFLWRF